MDKELTITVIWQHELEDYLNDERNVHQQLEHIGDHHVPLGQIRRWCHFRECP
jgi:hypothetical protein